MDSRISSNALLPPTSSDTQFPISLPYMTSSMIPVVRPVCHEKSDLRICFQTGTAFCPDLTSMSYSSRARCTLSAKIGRLFDIAKKNIWGPMANDGISRAIC